MMTTVYKPTETFDCSECDKQIVFEIALTQFRNDDGPYIETFDKIVRCLGVPKCQVFLDALPTSPLVKDWHTCPLYEIVHKYQGSPEITTIPISFKEEGNLDTNNV